MNGGFRHKLMWCCTWRLTSAVAFQPANSFLSVLCASRVLVLENGKMAEFDSPSNLISQRGAFHKMAKDSGLVWSRGVSLCLLLQRADVSNDRDTVLRANDLLLCFETSSSFHCTRRLGLLREYHQQQWGVFVLFMFIPHIKITTWILKPPHFYGGMKKPDLWVCFFCPRCPLLNSPTRCCHHHYYSSTHESFIQAVILSWGAAWLYPVRACTLNEFKCKESGMFPLERFPV